MNVVPCGVCIPRITRQTGKRHHLEKVNDNYENYRNLLPSHIIFPHQPLIIHGDVQVPEGNLDTFYMIQLWCCSTHTNQNQGVHLSQKNFKNS